MLRICSDPTVRFNENILYLSTKEKQENILALKANKIVNNIKSKKQPNVDFVLKNLILLKNNSFKRTDLL